MALKFTNAEHTAATFNGESFGLTSPGDWNSIGAGPTREAVLKWLADGNVPEEPEGPSLQDKKHAIDTEREHRLAAGVEWEGQRWYTDVIFQGQITARIAGWNAGIIPANAAKPVRSIQGHVHALNFEQHKQLALALFDYVESVYGWSWIEKAKL